MLKSCNNNKDLTDYQFPKCFHFFMVLIKVAMKKKLNIDSEY